MGSISSMIERKWRWLLCVAAIFFAVVVITLFNKVMASGKRQPIAFNHNLHKEAGVECIDCHRFFKTERYAGKPTLEVCLGCHEEALTESAEEAKIREYAKRNQEIPWKRLYRVPDHVFFTHQRHVSGAGLQCEMCHGKIGETVKPPSKPLKRFSMGTCMNCHRKHDASNDCLACHK